MSSRSVGFEDEWSAVACPNIPSHVPSASIACVVVLLNAEHLCVESATRSSSVSDAQCQGVRATMMQPTADHSSSNPSPADQSRLRNFLGRNPWRLFISGVIASFVVGFILDQANLTPQAFFVRAYESLQSIAIYLWNMGFSVVEPAIRYIGMGAAVVVPIWLIARTIRYLRSK